MSLCNIYGHRSYFHNPLWLQPQCCHLPMNKSEGLKSPSISITSLCCFICCLCTIGILYVFIYITRIAYWVNAKTKAKSISIAWNRINLVSEVAFDSMDLRYLQVKLCLCVSLLFALKEREVIICLHSNILFGNEREERKKGEIWEDFCIYLP